MLLELAVTLWRTVSAGWLNHCVPAFVNTRRGIKTAQIRTLCLGVQRDTPGPPWWRSLALCEMDVTARAIGQTQGDRGDYVMSLLSPLT